MAEKMALPDRPKAGAKKQDWVNYAAAHGMDYATAKAMTLPELQRWKSEAQVQAAQPDPTEMDEDNIEDNGSQYRQMDGNATEPDVGPMFMSMGDVGLELPLSVHELWCRVMESVRSVAKGDYNKDQRFHFRGIDATLDAVGPALRRHRVHVRPKRILEHSVTEYQSKSGSRMVNRLVRVEWEVTGPQGDSFTGESMGEAADSSDKSMSKAQSVAYRVFLLQALAIPTGDEPDFETHERATPSEREQAVRQAQSGQSYRSREEWEAAQRQAKAGEENQDSFPESSGADPWTGKTDEAQAVGKPDSKPPDAAEARKEMWRVAKELGWEWAKLSARFKSDFGMETAAADAPTLKAFQQQIEDEAKQEAEAKALVQNELGGKEVAPEGTNF